MNVILNPSAMLRASSGRNPSQQGFVNSAGLSLYGFLAEFIPDSEGLEMTKNLHCHDKTHLCISVRFRGELLH